MTKRTQNRVAESRFTLPTVMGYAIVVWLLSGLLAYPVSLAALLHDGWIQFVCFIVSAFLIVELNNSNALIRVYSRTVSCSFIALMCAGNFLFGSLSGAIVQLFAIAVYLALFRTYQDKKAVGWVYYTFLCVGLASGIFAQILFFVPILWTMMFFQLSSLCWRTFFASILGLVTPYWFALPWLIYQGNIEALAVHFTAMTDFQKPDMTSLTVNEVLFFVFVVLLGITGTIHYLRKKSGDNIRIRLFYDCFILMGLSAAVFLALQPQHYNVLIRLLIINVSPLIAHFLALTNTRITNIAFYVICTVALLMTIFNLWMPSLPF